MMAARAIKEDLSSTLRKETKKNGRQGDVDHDFAQAVHQVVGQEAGAPRPVAQE